MVLLPFNIYASVGRLLGKLTFLPGDEGPRNLSGKRKRGAREKK